MGQKVHPIGFRVGVIRDWESTWYLPERQFGDALYEDYLIRRYIKKNFSAAAISRVAIERAGSRIKATLYTAKPGVIIGRGGKGVDELKLKVEDLLKKTLKRDVHVHVSVQEVRQPDVDAQLVAESVAQQIEKRIAYKRAMRQAIVRADKIGVRGIRVVCSGRLAGAEMARREQDRKGKIPLQTLRADIDYGFAEAATTYGNIGVKVWIYKGDILPGQPRRSEVEPPRQQRGDGKPDRSSERGDGRGRGGRGGRGGGDRGPGGGGGGYRGGGDRGPGGGGGDRGPGGGGGGYRGGGDRGPGGGQGGPGGGGGNRGGRGGGGGGGNRGPGGGQGGPGGGGNRGPGNPRPPRPEQGNAGNQGGESGGGTPAS